MYHGPCSQGRGLPRGHTQLGELDHKEGRALKKWCLRTAVWRRLQIVLGYKEIKPVNLKGNQPWLLIGKHPDAKKDWGQKEKRASEDEMAGWYHPYHGHEIVQETGNKTIPKKKKCRKAKWLSEEALHIAVKRRKWKEKEKRKDISIWMQSSKE